MSSLAASRADGFYYPPNYDGEKHRTLNKYHKSHPLGNRASKLKSEGILTIRFEVPFKCICLKCGSFIGKGVRYNAEKKSVGMYYSTKIYEFKMTCYTCQNELVMQTDPKACEYLCIAGWRRKIEEFNPEDAGTVQLDTREEIHERRTNPMAALEHEVLKGKKNQPSDWERIDTLIHYGYERSYDDYTQHKELRSQLANARREDKIRAERYQPANFVLNTVPETGRDMVEASQQDYFVDKPASVVRPIFAKRDTGKSSARLEKLHRFKAKVGRGVRAAAFLQRRRVKLEPGLRSDVV